MKLRYFAWVREQVGVHEEEYDTQSLTVEDLLTELRTRGDGYALALKDGEQIRVAVDQELSDFTRRLENVSEVAFFPPMTGG